MADDLSNLGTRAFDPRVSRRGGFPTAEGDRARAFSLGATRCRPTPAGRVSTETARGRARRENAARERHAFGDVHGSPPVSTRARGLTVARAGTAGHRRGGAFLRGPRHRRSSAGIGHPSVGTSFDRSVDGTARRPIGGCRDRRAIDRCRSSLAGRVPGTARTPRASPPDPRLPFCQRFLPKRTRGHALTFHFAFPLLFRARRTQL